MSLNSALLLKLSALHLSPIQMTGVLEILAEALSSEEERRRKDRERKRKIRGQSSECPTDPPPKERISNPPPDDDGEGASANDFHGRLMAAAGPAMDDTRPAVQLVSIPRGWLSAGADLEQDVLPVIRAMVRGMRAREIKSWRYFENEVAKARQSRLVGLPSTNFTKRGLANERSERNDVAAVARRLTGELREAEQRAGQVIDLSAIRGG